MNDKIFRKEAIKRISSPEELNDYIKVAKPGIWVLLAAIIAFLVGFGIWGIFGTIESTTQAIVISENGQAILYVNEDSVDSLTEQMVVEINEQEYKIKDISTQSINASKVLDENELHAGNMSEGDWAYCAIVEGNLADGDYKATLVTEKVNPIYFITN